MLDKKKLAAIAIVLIVVSVAVGYYLLAPSDTDNDDDNVIEYNFDSIASNGSLQIGNVWHTPQNITTESHVDFYCEVKELPDGYTVYFFSKYTNENGQQGSSGGPYDHERGDNYSDAKWFTSPATGYYKIIIYEADWRQVMDITMMPVALETPEIPLIIK